MRRGNLLSLVALLVVALLAVVLITPSGAMAATSSSRGLNSSSMNFKGRAVAKNNDTHYFALSFTCSAGTLSAGWTYEVSSTLSYTGTVAPTGTGCALVSKNGGWSTSPDGTTVDPLTIPLLFGPNNATVGTLTLFLTAIVATKTFFPDTSAPCPSTSTPPSPCIEVTTSGFSLANATDFSSQCLRPPTPSSVQCTDLFATLNLSVH